MWLYYGVQMWFWLSVLCLENYYCCFVEWAWSIWNKSSYVFTICTAVLFSTAHAVWSSEYRACTRLVTWLILGFTDFTRRNHYRSSDQNDNLEWDSSEFAVIWVRIGRKSVSKNRTDWKLYSLYLILGSAV